MKTIPRTLRGRIVIFSAYDGKDYTAHVEKVKNGVAKLLYQVMCADGRKAWVNAYIDDAARIK